MTFLAGFVNWCMHGDTLAFVHEPINLHVSDPSMTSIR